MGKAYGAMEGPLTMLDNPAAMGWIGYIDLYIHFIAWHTYNIYIYYIYIDTIYAAIK